MRAAFLTLSLIVFGCDSARPEPRVTVSGAVVTIPAVPGRPGAAYFTLRSNNDPTRLVAVSSPAAARIELHETRTQGGAMRMGPLADATFPDGGEMVFAPGGRHAMLFGLREDVAVGGTIPLTFRFDPAPPVTVQAQVRAPGDFGGH